jgi:type III secretory pathway component EscU
MISLEDCVALSGLSEEQVLAIAEHEHLPEIAAAVLAQYLLKQEHGMAKIRDMIVETSARLNSARTSRTL